MRSAATTRASMHASTTRLPMALLLDRRRTAGLSEDSTRAPRRSGKFCVQASALTGVMAENDTAICIVSADEQTDMFADTDRSSGFHITLRAQLAGGSSARGVRRVEALRSRAAARRGGLDPALLLERLA